jgi:hypothetical protein
VQSQRRSALLIHTCLQYTIAQRPDRTVDHRLPDSKLVANNGGLSPICDPGLGRGTLCCMATGAFMFCSVRVSDKDLAGEACFKSRLQCH